MWHKSLQKTFIWWFFNREIDSKWDANVRNGISQQKPFKKLVNEGRRRRRPADASVKSFCKSCCHGIFFWSKPWWHKCNIIRKLWWDVSCKEVLGRPQHDKLLYWQARVPCPPYILGKVNCLFTFLVNISCLFTIWKLDMGHVPNRPSTDNTMHHNQQSMRLWHESHHAKRC